MFKVVLHESQTGDVYTPSSVTRMKGAKYVQVTVSVPIIGGKHVNLINLA